MMFPPPSPPPKCSIVILPANIPNRYDNIFDLFSATYSLKLYLSVDCYLCQLNGGNCFHGFECVDDKGGEIPIRPLFPPIPPQLPAIPPRTAPQAPATPPEGNQKKNPAETQKVAGWEWKLGLGVGCIAIIFVCLMLMFFWHRYNRKYNTFKKKDHQSIDAFLANHGVMAPKRYKYTEVKKMTMSFKDKLGEGGYGSVFKGRLHDGRLAAVKVLKDSKSSGEDFINEVASISRTSHVNIVTLLGFCVEGSKQALIYEFMSNGSLDKYLHQDPRLDWERLYRIGIGIARGLEYLHRGCNTRILHLDIKPNNILLDENFSPKISDFGLARICIRKESIISMTGPRGTAGYIAPEVFSRFFGGVSHKSDVYSYGMLVLEMVGGRNKNSATYDHSSEIYFPNFIFKHLEREEDLGLDGISNEEDKQIARKMVIMSLWCIQTDPSKRPAISRVIEMMEGSIESLPIPPKPYLASPQRPSPTSFVTSSITGIITS